jgi:hypothetical protein
VSVKDKLGKIKEKLTLRHHKKAYSFIVAGIIVVALFLTWFLGTPTGQLAQQSFSKSFNDIPEEHVIEVYSGNTKIKEYVGFYRVERYQSYLVILNDVTGERIDVYGASVIVNEKKDCEGE